MAGNLPAACRPGRVWGRVGRGEEQLARVAELSESLGRPVAGPAVVGVRQAHQASESGLDVSALDRSCPRGGRGPPSPSAARRGPPATARRRRRWRRPSAARRVEAGDAFEEASHDETLGELGRVDRHLDRSQGGPPRRGRQPGGRHDRPDDLGSRRAVPVDLEDEGGAAATPTLAHDAGGVSGPSRGVGLEAVPAGRCGAPRGRRGRRRPGGAQLALLLVEVVECSATTAPRRTPPSRGRSSEVGVTERDSAVGMWRRVLPIFQLREQHAGLPTDTSTDPQPGG